VAEINARIFLKLRAVVNPLKRLFKTKPGMFVLRAPYLYLPRRRAKEQARNQACVRFADGVTGRGELRMIEGVEELEFELALETLAEARRIDEREVYVFHRPM
jgi:hypothetical protein